MATNFPTSLDTNTEIKSTHANGETVTASDDNNQSDAIKALEAKVGINSSAVTTTLDYKLANKTHASLISVGANDHHTQLHASEHLTGGSDPITFSATGVRLVGYDFWIFKSGANYVALKVSDGTTPYTNANAASVINSAKGTLTNGGAIGLEPKTTFNCTSQISLSAGVSLVGTRIPSEGSNNPPLVASTSNIGGALISLDGTGASVINCNVDAGTTATQAILMNTDATSVTGGFLQGGTQNTLKNTLAKPRQRVSHVRCDGNGHCSAAVMEFNSTDHIVHDIVATGAGTAYAMTVNGNTGNFSSMHITGSSNSKDALLVAGDQNNFSSITLDTCGTNSTAPLLVTGARNMFSAVGSMNVFAGISRPALAISGAVGNQFHGFSYTAGAQQQNATGLVKFLVGGATPANLSAFHGTQIYFSSKDTDLLGGTLCNRMPITADGVWIRGYVENGSASGRYDLP